MRPSAIGDVVTPLTGSALWLVYQRAAQVVAHASLDGESIPTTSDDAASRVILARRTDGTTERVSKSRVADTGWSLAANVLTAARPYPSRKIDWWNLTTHAHGTCTLARGAGYVSSAPGGLFFTSAHGRLDRLNVSSGHVRSYGQPINAGIGGSTAVAGPNGVVVTRSDVITKYVAYNRPGHSVRLRTRGTGGEPVQCTAVSATDATCYGFSDDDDSATPQFDLVVPLTGSKPTGSHTCPGIPAGSGRRAIWAAAQTLNTKSHCDNKTIISLAAGAKAVTATAPPVTGTPTSAYKKAVFSTIEGDSMVGATSAQHSHTLFDAPVSPVSIGGFALSAGRITDTDDQVDHDHPTHRISVRSRTLAATPTTLTAGPASVVGGDVDNQAVYGPAVAASGDATAYFVNGRQNLASTLRVISPSGVVTMPDVLAPDTSAPTVTLSGNRVLYEHAATGNDLKWTWTLRDLRTGTTRDVGPADQGGSAGASLWGNYLVYLHGRSVIRQNLSSGSKVLVTTIAKNFSLRALETYGDYVLVDSQLFDVRTGKVARLKTVIPRSPLNVAPGISSAGVVILNAAGFQLHTWAGKTVTLRSRAQVLEGTRPQVEDDAMGWLSTASNLKVAPINVPVAQPRSLGDPIAPASLVANGSTMWQPSIPYSTPLTTCTMTISQGSTVVRALPCYSSQAALGVASVSWDGRDGGGTLVSAGSYVWAVHASGTSGAALNPAGANADVGGAITVTT
jgi:hypothetical protein